MAESFEMPSQKQEPQPILEQERVKQLIERRKIDPEDFKLLEDLAEFPNAMFIELLHNMFNMNKDKSLTVLEREIESMKRRGEQLKGTAHDPEAFKKKVELLETMHVFASKYDWAVCYNLVRVFEEKE